MGGGLRRPLRPLQVICVLVAACFVVAFSISPTVAQSGRGYLPVPNKPNLGTIGERINANTIAIVSGNLNATYLTIAYDLSAVLDDGDNFRILPVIGKGGGQNLRDVRFLKGVDLGITQSVLLNAARRTGEIGNIHDNIVYITKLFNEEMHLVVRADSGIESIEQLAGKKVNFSDIGSGTQLSTRDIFARLKIQAEEVNMGQADAFEKLKSGEIAATILIAGKPAGAMAKLKTGDGFRFLPIPFSKPLQDEYLPAALTNADYPGMISSGNDVDTIAVSAVMIAYNWPKWTDRYQRVEKFVQQFFPKLAEFQKAPRHPKWRETNLAATLPGWTRFPAADEWLKAHHPTPQAPTAATRESFKEFLAARGAGVPAGDQERLFQEFLKWSQARQRQ
jgi:uncharacterized protein